MSLPRAWGSFALLPWTEPHVQSRRAAGREHRAVALGRCLGPHVLYRWGFCCCWRPLGSPCTQGWLGQGGYGVSCEVAEPGEGRAGMGRDPPLS